MFGLIPRRHMWSLRRCLKGKEWLRWSRPWHVICHSVLSGNPPFCRSRLLYYNHKKHTLNSPTNICTSQITSNAEPAANPTTSKRCCGRSVPALQSCVLYRLMFVDLVDVHEPTWAAIVLYIGLCQIGDEHPYSFGLMHGFTSGKLQAPSADARCKGNTVLWRFFWVRSSAVTKLRTTLWSL